MKNYKKQTRAKHTNDCTIPLVYIEFSRGEDL